MRIRNIIIVFLSLCLVVLCITVAVAHKQKNELQASIDATFKNYLAHASGSLNSEVNEYSYRSMIANLSSAAAISELTSYEEINDDLDISLFNLYTSLREDKSKEKVLEQIEELKRVFAIMVQDPANKDATNRLIRIANETFFNSGN